MAQDWHAWLLGAFEDLKLDGIVYLRTTPYLLFYI